MNRQIHNQKGVVLVSALIVVALVSVSATILFNSQSENIKQTQYIQNYTQAIEYLYSLESWAKKMLKDDDTKIDTREEDWKTEEIAILIKNGSLKAELFDFQARLNINNMLVFDTENNYSKLKATPDYAGCYTRLNAAVDEYENGDAIIAYINDNNDIMQIEHLSHIKNLPQIDTEHYIKIRPFLTAMTNNIPININTASKEVLSCLHSDIDENVAEQIQSKEYDTIDDFHKELEEQNIEGGNLEKIKLFFAANFVSVNSSYFILKSHIIIDELDLEATTVFYRKKNSISTYNRTYHIN